MGQSESVSVRWVSVGVYVAAEQPPQPLKKLLIANISGIHTLFFFLLQLDGFMTWYQTKMDVKAQMCLGHSDF